MAFLPASPSRTVGLKCVVLVRPGYLRMYAAGSNPAAIVQPQSCCRMTSFVVRSAKRSQNVLSPSFLNSLTWLWYPRGHAERLERGRDRVHLVGQRLALLRVGECRVAGHDEEAAPDGLVELDRALERVAPQHVHAHVGAGGLQVQRLELRGQAGRIAGVVVVAGELDAVETHGGHLLERGVEVLACSLREPSRAGAPPGILRDGRGRHRAADGPGEWQGARDPEERAAAHAGRSRRPDSRSSCHRRVLHDHVPQRVFEARSLSMTVTPFVIQAGASSPFR